MPVAVKPLDGLGYQVVLRYRLRPRHIVLDGDQAPLPKRGTPPIFGPCLLRPNGWMDQDATWYRSRPQPRPHCVRWAPSSPTQKTHSPSPIFGLCLLLQTVAHLSYCWALVAYFLLWYRRFSSACLVLVVLGLVFYSTVLSDWLERWTTRKLTDFNEF